MKKLLFLFLLLPFISSAQSTGYFRFDTSLFYKVGGNNELILQNSTRGTTGVLYNYNNGRTRFEKPTAITGGFKIGTDTVLISGGGNLDTNAVWKQGGNFDLGADGTFGTGSNHGIIFKTNNTARFKVYNNGNFVGGTSTTDDGHSFRWSGNMSFNLGSDATGDMFYRNASGTFTRLPIGTSSQYLGSSGTLPQWNNPLWFDSLRRLPGSLNVQGRKNGVWYTQYTDSISASLTGYIENGTSVQSSANYNIDGTGITAFHKTNGTIATDVFNYHAGYNKTHFSYGGGAVGNTAGYTNGFFSGGINSAVPFAMVGQNVYWNGSDFVIPYTDGGVSLAEYRPDQINWRLTNALTQYAFLNTTEFGVMTNLRINGSFEPNNLPGTAGQVLTSQGAGNNPTWETPNSVMAIQSIATSGGTTTLTASSVYHTVFTGSSSEILQLPDATTLSVGHRYKITNNSSAGSVVIKNPSFISLFGLAPETSIDLFLISNGSADGTWDADYHGVLAAPTVSVLFQSPMEFAGGSGAVMSMPTSNANIAATNISQTWTAKPSFDADATNADIRLIGHAGDPSSLSNGDLWYNSSTHEYKGRANGSTITFGNVASGIYTPTGTGVANVGGSSIASGWTYTRIGDIVSVSGQVSITPTSASSTATEFGITLPISSSLSGGNELNGVATNPTLPGESAAVEADATNDRAALKFTAQTTTARTYKVVFTYRVL